MADLRHLAGSSVMRSMILAMGVLAIELASSPTSEDWAAPIRTSIPSPSWPLQSDDMTRRQRDWGSEDSPTG